MSLAPPTMRYHGVQFRLTPWAMHQKVARISAGLCTALRTEWPAATHALGESAGLRLEVAE